MPAATPGVVTMTLQGPNDTLASVVETYDPDTGLLAADAFTCTGTLPVEITVTCTGGAPVYRWPMTAGTVLTAALLAGCTDAEGNPITSDTQIASVTLTQP